MKNLKIISILLLALTASSPSFANDDFDSGTSEFDQPTAPLMTEAEIQKKISNEMAVVCNRGLCTIASSDSKGDSFTVSFNVGYGTSNGANNPNGNVFVIGDANTSSNPQASAGVTITYAKRRCHSEINVTPAVYRFLNSYIYSMINPDGSMKRNFTPADQTALLFYTTILNKAEVCKAQGN